MKRIPRKVLSFGLVLLMVFVIFTGMLMNVSGEEESSTLYISDDATGGDATSIGTWDWPTKTCTLTMDVYETIMIIDDGITLDGNGYSISYGSGYYGVWVRDQTDVTIRNLDIDGFRYGIYMYRSSQCTIEDNAISNCVNYGTYLRNSNDCSIRDNTISNNQYGMRIYRSESSTISGNTITDSDYYGMYLIRSGGSTLTENSISSNDANFYLFVTGTDVYDIDDTNTVEGKPILYSVNEENVVYNGDIDGDYGLVYIINGDSVTVKNMELSPNNYYNVYVYGCLDSTVENIDVSGGTYGIYLRNSEGSSIKDCSVTDCEQNGIYISYSVDTSISGNTLTGCGNYGMSLSYSSSSTLKNNKMSSNNRNFYVAGSIIDHYGHNIDDTNLVEGKPILYSYKEKDKVYDGDVIGDYGVIFVIGGDSVTVKNIELASNNLYNVYFYYSKDSTIENVRMSDGRYGIYLEYSEGSFIKNCAVTDVERYGIYLLSSASSIIRENTVTNIEQYGMFISDSESLIIKANTITESDIGAFIRRSSVKFLNNIISNVNYNGIHVYIPINVLIKGNTVSGAGDKGIALYQEGDINVVDNTISNSNTGIYNGYSEGSMIRQNTITSNTNYGIYVEKSTSTTLNGNTLTYNGKSIYLFESGSNTIIENLILSNDLTGIYMSNSNNNIILGNTISNNQDGIVLSASNANTIKENLVSENDMGINILLSNSNNIFHNNIIDNTEQADDNGMNAWDNDKKEGNYWSDYNGEDTDKDGFGDTNTPHLGLDYYPMMKPIK
jgi:parallel beta-helix repeat protein